MGDEKKKGSILKIVIPVLILLAAAAGIALWLSGRYLASTMRLERLEGTVQLEDESGREQELVSRMRFKSGNALRTEGRSLVGVSLDSSKLVTLDENSRADFVKQFKFLELKLTAGRLYFNVSKPLPEDEEFDIRTSTMVMGIRGTSGYVTVDEFGNESLTVTDGTVHVIGTNPVTGEVKEIDVRGGESIRVYLFNDRTVDSIEFRLEAKEEKDLPHFALRMLVEDEPLMEKVCDDTDWSPSVIHYYYENGSEEDERERTGNPAGQENRGDEGPGGRGENGTGPGARNESGSAARESAAGSSPVESASQTGSEAGTAGREQNGTNASGTQATRSSTAVRSTAAGNTAAQNTAAGNTAAGSTAAQTAAQNTAAETLPAAPENTEASLEITGTAAGGEASSASQTSEVQYTDADGNPLDDDEIGPWLDYPDEESSSAAGAADGASEGSAAGADAAAGSGTATGADTAAGADTAGAADTAAAAESAAAADTSAAGADGGSTFESESDWDMMAGDPT